jgi:hypothetical protein
LEEAPEDKVSNIEYHVVLKEFEDVFQQVLGIPLKRDINFSINLKLGKAPVLKVPYRMSMSEMKELYL